MNIVDAFKSGLPVRRKTKNTWVGTPSIDYNLGTTYYNTMNNRFIDPEFLISSMRIDIDDIVADDWEVKHEAT